MKKIDVGYIFILMKSHKLPTQIHFPTGTKKVKRRGWGRGRNQKVMICNVRNEMILTCFSSTNSVNYLSTQQSLFKLPVARETVGGDKPGRSVHLRVEGGVGRGVRSVRAPFAVENVLPV